MNKRSMERDAESKGGLSRRRWSVVASGGKIVEEAAEVWWFDWLGC